MKSNISARSGDDFASVCTLQIHNGQKRHPIFLE